MGEKKLRTIKPTPLKGRLKDRDIQRAVLAVKAAREEREKRESRRSR